MWLTKKSAIKCYDLLIKFTYLRAIWLPFFFVLFLVNQPEKGEQNRLDIMNVH